MNKGRSRNIRLVIAYDGTLYAGWQRQPGVKTIQGEIEKAVARMCAEGDITVHGAGRTDAGVHARGMVANFRTTSRIPDTGFLKGLNSILPDDIRIMESTTVSPGFHARFSATGKEYLYTFFTGVVMPPTLRLYAAHVPNVDIPSMREALRLFVGSHDFSGFEATGSRDRDLAGARGAVRNIFSAALSSRSDCPDCHVIAISGDGFLRHMVRNIVGTLFETGKGRMSLKDITAVFDAGDRTLAGPTAPARGLLLNRVFY